MKPFVLSHIPKEDVDLLAKIRLVVDAFPDGLDFGQDAYGKSIILSCHILAHAVGKIFSLKVEDGYFYPNYEHSWLKTKTGHIIDIYPVGILGGPFLIEQTRSFLSPGRYLYQPDIMVWDTVGNSDMQRAISIATSFVHDLTREMNLIQS